MLARGVGAVQCSMFSGWLSVPNEWIYNDIIKAGALS